MDHLLILLIINGFLIQFMNYVVSKIYVEGEGEWSYHYVNIAPQQRGSSDGHVLFLERIKTILILYCYYSSNDRIDLQW